ncbi:MAG TPA: TadE/TadG family type IV pilus assembly protein [Xanthobacteraceae bacterium]|nr:TadE/TadG family type IV pilus assembly protein [Xanthobacteraceae bacterium]
MSNNHSGKEKRGIRGKLRSLARDCRGISAIEFAFVFPIMAALFLGGTAITQGIVIKRKVTLATRTVGDLASQDKCITDNEMTAIFTAATAVFQPYSTNSMTLIVTSLKIDEDGNATVDWSDKTVNGGAREAGRTVGDTVALPAGINEPSTYVVMAEGSYTYAPTVGSSFVGTLPLSEKFYLRPRRVPNITRVATTCP